jgi:hypothetical protein
VTNQQQKLGGLAEPEIVSRIEPGPALLAQVSNEAIAAGVWFLSSQWRGRKWSCSRNGSDVWTTAYILARLGELPPDFLTLRLRQQMEDSLDWLAETQTPGGGWSFAPEEAMDDAGCTAWAVLAFRQHGRPVSNFARGFLRRRHQPDGTFAAHPYKVSAPEGGRIGLPATAIVIRALGTVTSSSCELLEQGLRAASLRQGAQVSGLFACSDILDWQPGATPLSLLNEVRQAVGRFTAKSALEQALLLRCLVRLRLKSSWAVAAELGQAQQGDGSWSGTSAGTPAMFPDDPVVSTATAVSALAMRELQPGLYFGADLPYRRSGEV